MSDVYPALKFLHERQIVPHDHHNVFGAICVSRETANTDLLIAVVNDLEDKIRDVPSAYTTASVRKKGCKCQEKNERKASTHTLDVLKCIRLHSGLTNVSACLVSSIVLVWLTPTEDCHEAT